MPETGGLTDQLHRSWGNTRGNWLPRDTCTSMFVLHYSQQPRFWGRSGDPVTDAWVKKMWYTSTMAFTQPQRTELCHEGKHMEMEVNVVCETSQTQKNRHHMVSPILISKKKKKKCMHTHTHKGIGLKGRLFGGDQWGERENVCVGKYEESIHDTHVWKCHNEAHCFIC